MSAQTSTEVPPQPLPLIETKLVPPRLGREVVIRDRLLAELDRHSSRALTLVEAPVGFGKTVLVQSWCAHTDSAVAWVSLDAGDNDPSRLWAYIATSVDRVRSGLGRGALARLRSLGAPIEVAVDELVNGVTAYAQPLAIVLDDLHLVTEEACLSSLEHAFVHLPANARMIATTRADPALPLGRLRGRGALSEIRAHALALTVDEARELLVSREGIALDDESVELLVERTEGWPAGLYLAALWLRDLEDPAAGVRNFHGDHRHIADYLTSEVLDALDADTRRFLVETSVLGRFSPTLCDYVLGRSDSSACLREIERTNGFLIALDPQGEWYRYHHLFAELLKLELAHTEPRALTRIHVRASDWCRENGLTEDALEHAAAASDEGLIATILSDNHRALLRSGQMATILRWVTTLPDELLLERPELPLAGALASGMLGHSHHERKRLISLAARVRAEKRAAWGPYHEVMLGLTATPWVENDVGESLKLIRGAADLARTAVPEGAVPALAILGLLLFLTGELAEARAAAEEALARPEVERAHHGHVVALASLALIHAEAGAADTAEAEALKAVEVAEEAGISGVSTGGLAHVALASALAAGGRLRRAEREALEGERLRRHPEPEAVHLYALVTLAGIRARRGELAHARAHLDEVNRGLEAFDDPGRLPELALTAEGLLAQREESTAPLAEPLTAAEMNVLGLLASELSLREIAARLYLSRNTVKTHTRALYRKLGVSSREEAVVEATALGLLASDESPG